MCGIFGYFDQQKRSLSDANLQAMGESIIHRGPDDVGIHSQKGVALGNRRLAIIDIAGGHQPFISEDGNIVVVQNGEIFNHIELAKELALDGYACRTHSDTEVILRLYQRDGIDLVHRLNGMFAIAIYDKRVDALYLIRDRIGVKPLYIHHENGRLYFASEIKALLRASIPARMNYTALDYFLTYNYVPPPLTMFDGITHLEPGHWLRIDRNGLEKQQWWDLSKQRVESRSEKEWIDEFNLVLDDAVRLRLRSDVPFGAFLSGGVDSSTIVGLMAKHMDQPVDTFTIGFNEARFDESPYADAAAKRFSTNHTMEKVDANMLNLWPKATYYCDQPHGDISFLPTFRVSELAARNVKVVLTGDGADELFAGYDKYKEFFSDEFKDGGSDKEFQKQYLQKISLFTKEAKKLLYTAQLQQKLGTNDAFEIVRPMFEQTSHMDRINQALYLDMMLLLPGNNLVKPDRMGMAVSLEARTPFLDYRMMELAFRMPGDLKLKDGETKYIYKKAVKGLIGDELAYRKKQMFTVPVGEWFKDSLVDFTEQMLLDDRTVKRRLFNTDIVQDMLSQHQAGLKNYTRGIRALISVELWSRIFLDDDYHSAPSLETLGVTSVIQ